MENTLSYVFVTPYTIAKSRTGGVVSRLLSRLDLELVGAQMIAVDDYFAKAYGDILREQVDPQNKGAASLLGDYVEQYMGPSGGRPHRSLMMLFRGTDACKKLSDICGALYPENRGVESLTGETIRDTYADLIVDPENPEKIIFPVFGKKRGHPPLIPVVLRPTILGWKREGNLKEILDSHEKLALEINVPDNNILLDIDTPDDYARLQKRFHFYEIPTEEESEIILTDICQVPYNIRLHCIKVAEVADNIGKSLVKAGQNPDLDVIHAAAMLHDIAKGKFEHDITGGRWLSEMGFAKTGKIVSVHTDLGQGNEEVSLESKIVYLADKFVKGDKLVSLEERYQSSFNRCGSNPEVEAIVLQRQKRAKSVKEELDRILGYPLEQIIDNL